MMNKRKPNKTYGIFLRLLLAAALLLTGCGAGVENTAGETATSMESVPKIDIDWSTYRITASQRTEDGTQWYLTEYHDNWITPYGSEYDERHSTNTGTIDGMIYNNYRYQSGSVEDNNLQVTDYMYCYDAQTGQSVPMELNLGEYGLQEGAYLWDMDMADDQLAVFLLRKFGEEEMPIPYASLLFYHMEDGVQKNLDLLPILASLGIENELGSRDYLLRQGCILCDRDGCCYLLWNENLLVLGENGELLCHMKGTGDLPPTYLCKTPEGFPLFVLSDMDTRASTYWTYDHDTGEMRSLGESKYFALKCGGCMDTAGNLYYFSDTCNIVKWNILSGEREKIFDCKANLLSSNDMSRKIMTVREDGDLVIMDPLNARQNIFVLSPTPPVENRTLTLVSATRGESIIPAAATLFSSRNPGVNIEISSFETSGSDDLDAYTTNLINRIVAGNAPDMFVVSAETMYTLYEKGALAELTSAIPVDTQEQVFDCIWNAGTIDGKLMGLTTDQITYSMLVSDELWAQDTWRLEDVLELADNAGDTLEGLIPISEYDPSPLRWFALYDIESSLVDRASGTCHFDSEVFRRLLEYCKNNSIIAQNPEMYNTAARAVMNGEYLAYAWDNYFGFSDFCARMSLFPENYHWVGVPTDGESGNLLYARDFLVVNKDTANMDLIAEFLPTLYGDELTRLYPDRCLRRDVLRERVTDAYPGDNWASFYMGEGVYRSLECKPDGTSYVEDYIEFMDRCILMPPEDSAIATIVIEETQPYFAGDKDMDTVIGIIQSRVQLYLDENGS